MEINKGKNLSSAGDELRRRAEVLLGENRGAAFPHGTEEDPLKLLHELQVHRIELEMQNAELYQAREDLEVALDRYTDLYDFAPVGYLTFDRKGIIQTANLTGADLIGIERSRLIGLRFGRFLTAETCSVFDAFLEKVFLSPAKETCKVTLLNKGNSGRLVQIEGVTDASGKECRVALIDITEQFRAEEAIRREKEAAEAICREKEAVEAVVKEKSQFLANISHELRTPMTGILGMLQLALEKELAPQPREFVEKSLSSARSLLRILNDIIDMARIEAGKLSIEEKPFSLRESIGTAMNILTPEASRKGLDFTFAVAEEVPDAVVGDQVRLRQVLINLLANAVKFTHGGKVALRVNTAGANSDGRLEFAFSITDTGIGIPADRQRIIFQAFSQVDDSHSRVYGGTGLGLAICREIVGLMGGWISFESEAGTGSTFSFTIPMAEAGPECGATIAAESLLLDAIIPAAVEERKPRLLLAEDDPDSRMVFGLMLKRANYDLDIAVDGQMAVELWENGEYDLVLMDAQMPRLNGFEATRAIREKERERGTRTPIIAITAHASKEDEETCLAAGMDAFLSKPFDFNECLQVIGEHIKRNSD